MTDLHQTRTVPARDVLPFWEIREQGEWALVVKREERGDVLDLHLVAPGNAYSYDPAEPVVVRVPVSRFVVEVRGCTPAQAAQVMAERLNHDEDYGFEYQVDWAVTS